MKHRAIVKTVTCYKCDKVMNVDIIKMKNEMVFVDQNHFKLMKKKSPRIIALL